MAARAEDLLLTYRQPRRIFGPGLKWTFLTIALAVLRQLTPKPSLPRMSAEWLHSHEREFNRPDY
jgi:hypothetical protein